ncbi:hypothetical protein EVAR_24832_1 [Eumeta japonica]|uniref:Uncharacterized protein n=1 Tax=Eumeta variegata TaxID=151549 RepID=A0A4C1W4B1_EUMVA|nr:hypothetical protein EVAR_24832_1 [Eumeta japonica]
MVAYSLCRYEINGASSTTTNLRFNPDLKLSTQVRRGRDHILTDGLVTSLRRKANGLLTKLKNHWSIRPCAILGRITESASGLPRPTNRKSGWYSFCAPSEQIALANAVPAFWKGKGYLVDGYLGRWRGSELMKGKVGHRNCYSLEEAQRRKLLLHVCIRCLVGKRTVVTFLVVQDHPPSTAHVLPPVECTLPKRL